jgi:hypothetical protein
MGIFAIYSREQKSPRRFLSPEITVSKFLPRRVFRETLLAKKL